MIGSRLQSIAVIAVCLPVLIIQVLTEIITR